MFQAVWSCQEARGVKPGGSPEYMAKWSRGSSQGGRHRKFVVVILEMSWHNFLMSEVCNDTWLEKKLKCALIWYKLRSFAVCHSSDMFWPLCLACWHGRCKPKTRPCRWNLPWKQQHNKAVMRLPVCHWFSLVFSVGKVNLHEFMAQ